MRLGPRIDGDGVRFAVFSGVADAVEVCVFDERGAETRRALECGDDGVWQGYVAGACHGTRYGVRVHGPWDPAQGLRCNPAKLLLDPYARAITGSVEWHPALYGDSPEDSAPYMPRSMIRAEPFDWGDDRAPATPLADSIVYEAHVKGLTQLHPDVPPEARGTYAGVAHDAIIAHLRRLGVTALELLPVHHFVHDTQLVERGLRNYWGYQPIGYFAPHDEYAATGDPVAEFKSMVRALHKAGIEVLLDVVYNHTAEGDERGPTLCFRGLDNPAYYRLASDRSRYVDDTGVGNTLDTHRPAALQLVMDSLRYWVEEMHVDGFRFDLAATLGRGATDFDPLSGFLDAIAQDPTLSEAKLIAEPWDWGGFALGEFPRGWSEWNGRYRDTVRDFWRGTPGTLPDLATRLTGSADLFGHGRRPTASINIVTVHDGFTLNDLVSYDTKHNEANGDDNRDGNDDNRSWNCGVEGPTTDADVLALRARQRRNLLATMLLSDGVPLVLGGDELGRTQRGNNNAYCQDNEISWIDWRGDAELTGFVAEVSRIRREHPVFRRTRFFRDGELRWLRPDGEAMANQDWNDPDARALAVAGSAGILLVNGWWETLEFQLPDGRLWRVELDTHAPADGRTATRTIALAGRSLVLLSAR